MWKAWDADGHVEESEVTFSDPYWDPRFRDQRPTVVEIDARGSLSWIIDGRTFPVFSGPGLKLGRTPLSRNGVPSPTQRQREELDPLESSEFRSAAARLAILDRENIGLQVNYPTMLLSWPLAFSPGLGAAIARAYNSWMADISSQAAERLKWVTVLDPHDPREAAREIYRTKELGSVGVMVWGLIGHKHLDHPSFEPIWQACADTGLPLAVHPGFSGTPLEGLYTNSSDGIAVPFVLPVLMAFHRVVAKGLLDRYPTVKVAFLETGCSWVPFMVERLHIGREPVQKHFVSEVEDAFRRSFRGGYQASLLPEEYIQRGQVYFGFEVEEEMLPYVIEKYGDECWLFASDIPHSHRLINAPEVLWRRQDISEESKRKLLVDNTARFYGLPVPQNVAASS